MDASTLRLIMELADLLGKAPCIPVWYGIFLIGEKPALRSGLIITVLSGKLVYSFAVDIFFPYGIFTPKQFLLL